jgi:hypothetical protein
MISNNEKKQGAIKLQSKFKKNLTFFKLFTPLTRSKKSTNAAKRRNFTERPKHN